MTDHYASSTLHPIWMVTTVAVADCLSNCYCYCWHYYCYCYFVGYASHSRLAYSAAVVLAPECR